MMIVICILFSCRPPINTFKGVRYSENKSNSKTMIFNIYNLQFEVGDTIILYPLIDEDFGHARIAFSLADDSYYSTQDKIMIEGRIFEKLNFYSDSNEISDILFKINVTNIDKFGVLFNDSDTLKVGSVFRFKSSSYGRNLSKK